MPDNTLVFGFETNHVSSIREILQIASSSNSEFVVIPLFHPRLRRDGIGVSNARPGPATRSDRELESRDWIANVIGKLSDYLTMDFDGITRLNNEQTFHQEMAWASHLGLQAVLLPSPSIKSPNYSRCILQYCSSTSYQQLWIRIPFHQPLRSDNVDLGYGDVSDGWIAWNNLRVMTGHVHNICVALELNSEISQDDFEFSYKWTAEPVKALILPTNMFLFNKAGYPVLSRIHQDFISIFLKFKIQIVFKGNPRATNSDGLDSNEGYKPYIQYLTYLQDKLKAQLPPEDAFIQGYRDRLQYPLQPLMDNLESQTYETFERDTVKYLQYGRAVISAITYLQKQMLLRNGTKYHNDQQDGLDTIHTTLIITVVGAGRGPLVSAAITAALEVNQSVRIYAVEKNENAIITLRNRVITERWTNVTVIHSDMRDWTPPELAHIMISELLGSWGDNELSPECLDGAQKCLFPDVGISIPMNYTSYLAPVSASRLWTCARDMPIQRDIQSFLDSPFVVKLHNYHQLSRSEPVFHFHHPHSIRDASFIDNRRYISISFESNSDALLHGFGGTFISVLHGDVTLSTLPDKHTPNMNSWFPLFLPLAAPVTVTKNDIITIHIWRCVNTRKVWYEWCLSSPFSTPIQNSGGKSYWIGL